MFPSYRTLISNSTVNDLVKPITVRTCVNILPRLAFKHPHIFQTNNLPTDGVDISIDCVDTLNGYPNPTSKTIVAIHGTPGNYSHFDQLINNYRLSNVRVIVPNLPNFTHTRLKRFWHTTEEKACFIQDLMKHLGIKKIDCLVSHSMGVHPLTMLCENPGDLDIKSVAILAPQPMWDLRPDSANMLKKIFFSRSNLWYELLSLTKLDKGKVTKVRFNDFNEFLWLMLTVLYENTASVDIYRRIDYLRRRSTIPVVVQFGEKEPIASRKSVMKLFNEFGIDSDKLIQFNPDELASELFDDLLKQDTRIKGYYFLKGGHFSYAKNSNYTCRMIDNLLSYYD
ncbi:hypothetical protein BLOT_003479 [Blomia tropicalis]|nr:hypothetical protein BLOT_003479 [Blomia tropicalis]